MSDDRFFVLDSNNKLVAAKFLTDTAGNYVVDPNWGRSFYSSNGSLVTDYSSKYFKLYDQSGQLGEQQIYKVKFGPKADRHGLKHDGAIDGEFEQFRKLFVVHDVLYPAMDPKDMFLICAANEIKDVTEDPSWDRKPICQHYFYSAVLGATMKLLYRRIYAADWRGIQERVERLFSSFEIVER